MSQAETTSHPDSTHDPRTWWKHGVIYQIYPRSFADSDGDGVGDLQGVIDHLDHLNDGTPDGLGVETIWLSPIYPSPMADFGYDVADYRDIHPLFGTLAEFDRLLEEAHKRGMKVIIDWVPNHTSDQHEWFRESRRSRDNPKRDWYVWRDGSDGQPPNNWTSAFPRVGDAWSFDDHTGQWYLHSFMPEQPDLNWDNPEVEKAMQDTLRFWLDRGVDGLRIDVAHMLGKDPELRDNPPEVSARGLVDVQRYDEDWPSGHDRHRGIRSVLDEYEGRMAVGEVYLMDQRRLVEYVNAGDELHMAHNFVFLHKPWDAAAFREAVDEWESLATREAWPVWFLNNHDHSRVASRYGETRSRVAAMLILTLRGTGSLFHGEELGLKDVDVPAAMEVDVDGRDPERAPLPWAPPSEAGAGAGFTTGTPWLPMTPDAEQVNAATQANDPRSMLAYYRRLIHHRNGSPVLQRGSYSSVDAGPDIFAYLRETADERVLVALNFSSQDRALDLSLVADEGEIALSTDDERKTGVRTSLAELALGGDEGVIVSL